jgi:hypothetical protein
MLEKAIPAFNTDVIIVSTELNIIRDTIGHNNCWHFSILSQKISNEIHFLAFVLIILLLITNWACI